MVDKRSVAPVEDALLDVTQRLARRIDQQLTQLRRLRTQPIGADAGIGELEHLACRIRRDAGGLRLLCGADPGGPDASAQPRAVSDILAEVAPSSAEPARVSVQTVPTATIEPRAAAELLHVLDEVVDGALAESDFEVTIGGRLGPAGLTLDVAIKGPRRPRQVTEQVAEAMARRSAGGVQVHRGVDGPYAIVLCPLRALTVPVEATTEIEPAPVAGRRPDPFDQQHPAAAGTALFSLSHGNGRRGDNGNGNGRRGGEGRLPALQRLGADPLFGPLPAMEPIGTPIYEAVASVWFVEDGFAAGTDGDAAVEPTAGELEWRAATERAAQIDSERIDTTASGLPRRRPGRQMVTPPLPRGGPARETGVLLPEERAPERVRHRLDDYQRGLRHGRHRAVEAESGA